MKFTSTTALACSAILLWACSDTPSADEQSAPQSEIESDALAPTDGAANLVEIRAVGMTLEGPSQIPSGWTTLRFVNASDMIHFAIVDVPPAGVVMGEFAKAMNTFQSAMDAINKDDVDGMNAAFGQFPAWMGDLGRMGGPGFLSPGLTGETTVFLEPGTYIIECYVKSNGVFHTTSPSEEQLGMMLEVTVTDETTDAVAPTSNATVSISNDGFAITEGTLQAGANIIAVEFAEQQIFPSVVGNDLHVMRVTNGDSIPMASAWLNWMEKAGLEDPAPVTFLGGVNDMPAGSTAYLHIDLEPGTYAFIAEVPDPLSTGHTMSFTIE